MWGKKWNPYTQRKFYVSLWNHLPGPRWKHTFPQDAGRVLLADSSHLGLSGAPVTSKFMSPLRGQAILMMWLWRQRPALLTGDFSAPKHALWRVSWGFHCKTPQFTSCLCPSWGPNSLDRLLPVNPLHTHLHHRLLSRDPTCPRSGFQGWVSVSSSSHPVSGAQLCFEKLFWHILSNISTCLWLKEESVLAQSDKFLDTSLLLNL